MIDNSAHDNDDADRLRGRLRDARMRYDQLSQGHCAHIRRCKTASDLLVEGSYWRIGGALAHEEQYLPHVVLLFPFASHVRHDRFSFGCYLHAHLGNPGGATFRFRRLLDSRDGPELDRQLRAIMRLVTRARAPVDWGVVGTDILDFYVKRNEVRRRWAQDFYAPTSSPGVSTPTDSNGTVASARGPS